ncbi:hypothetical protein AAUPMB_09806, partial [Pasteurella multocida subsp. multocida str. Anand1_buffalo]
REAALGKTKLEQPDVVLVLLMKIKSHAVVYV